MSNLGMNVIIHDGPVPTDTVFTDMYDSLTDFCRASQYSRNKLLEMLVNSMLNNKEEGRYETVLPMLLRVNTQFRSVAALRVGRHIEDGAYTACMIMQLSNPSWVATLDRLDFLVFAGGEGELQVTLSIDGLIPANSVPQELTITPRYSRRRAVWAKLKSAAARFRGQGVSVSLPECGVPCVDMQLSD